MVGQRGAAELLRAYYAALDAPDLDQLDTIFGPDSVWEFPGTRAIGGAEVKRRMAGSIATGVHMTHNIGHMVEQGDVAICELVATNVLGAQTFLVGGAVVCEARDGRIARICAYPDAVSSAPFFAAMAEAARARRRS